MRSEPTHPTFRVTACSGDEGATGRDDVDFVVSHSQPVDEQACAPRLPCAAARTWRYDAQNAGGWEECARRSRLNTEEKKQTVVEAPFVMSSRVLLLYDPRLQACESRLGESNAVRLCEPYCHA